MLPVVKGSEFTAKAISRYGWATVILSVFGIWALPEGGLLYGTLLIPLNARLLQMIYRLTDTPEDLGRAKGLFSWSILYMFGICFLLVISRQHFAVQFDLQGMEYLAKVAIMFSLI